jgi:predicted RNase H-like HicB family nuclease
MTAKVYRIFAEWDAEANWWVAHSEDVPGLATGVPTVEALMEKLRVMVPELLEANGCLPPDAGEELPIDLVATHREKIRLRA